MYPKSSYLFKCRVPPHTANIIQIIFTIAAHTHTHTCTNRSLAVIHTATEQTRDNCPNLFVL